LWGRHGGTYAHAVITASGSNSGAFVSGEALGVLLSVLLVAVAVRATVRAFRRPKEQYLKPLSDQRTKGRR